MALTIRILETAADMEPIEELQRAVWPGSEVDIVPIHLLVTVAMNGGTVIGAFEDERLVGYAFGFPGVVEGPDGVQLKHCSHQLGVDPAYRDQGLGFAIKRAQWQIVRNQGIDLITWTYDPLQSRNANLNMSKLGSVCNTYKRDVYGTMRDGLNAGIPSDRFLVYWWLNSSRVKKRVGEQPRRRLDLAHFLQANAEVCNPTAVRADGLPVPPELFPPFPWSEGQPNQPLLVLVEIPSDIEAIKKGDLELAFNWRLHSRTLFEDLFANGYLVTDFVFLSGATPRSFYVLSHGNSTLGA